MKPGGSTHLNCGSTSPHGATRCARLWRRCIRFTLDLSLYYTHVGQQGFITVARTRPWVIRCIAPQPAEIPTDTDLQHLTSHTDVPLPPHLVNPGVPRSVSYAKYAAAFFAMSRSIRNRATSALSRASSICSDVTTNAPSLSPMLPSSPLRSCRTQLLRLAFGIFNTLTCWAIAYGRQNSLPRPYSIEHGPTVVQDPSPLSAWNTSTLVPHRIPCPSGALLALVFLHLRQ